MKRLNKSEKHRPNLPPNRPKFYLFVNWEGWMKFGPFCLLGIDGASGNIINESAEVLALKTEDGWQTTKKLHHILFDTEYLLISSTPYIPRGIRNGGVIFKPETTNEDENAGRHEEDLKQHQFDM